MTLAFLLAALTLAQAQWNMQDSHTTANLRGIASLGGGVAWASGTGGTVLRTEDGGYLWQVCATPPDAAQLDFRAVQAIDQQTAFVMSAGPGTLSRLYKTTDGCRNWQLIFTNPDKDGFWDALFYDRASKTLYVLGDPVNGEFRLFRQTNGGEFSALPGIKAAPDQAAFAASNSLLVGSVGNSRLAFVTGGSRSEMIGEERGLRPNEFHWSHVPLPFAAGQSSGAFSVAARPSKKSSQAQHLVAVGGDYQHPDGAAQTAAYSHDGGLSWHPAETSAQGYRSAVAYDSSLSAWIAVGTNGTDISHDNGRTWKSITTGADGRDWNALSLPFVVGPHGRIGKLRSSEVR